MLKTAKKWKQTKSKKKHTSITMTNLLFLIFPWSVNIPLNFIVGEKNGKNGVYFLRWKQL